MKAIVLTIILLVIIGAAYAFTGYITTFTTDNQKENITFTGNENRSLYVDIPRYVYVNSFTINITGFERAS